MSGLEITCANKNRNGSIVRVGGNGWTLSTHDAIVKLVSHQVRLYVRAAEMLLDVGVRGDGFDAYLVLEPDGMPLQDLASLPSCG